MDGQLSTIFAPGAVTESGGYLQYLISEDNDISSVKILQESGSVCDAAVKVQTADGQWHELGALDMAVSVLRHRRPGRPHGPAAGVEARHLSRHCRDHPSQR